MSSSIEGLIYRMVSPEEFQIAHDLYQACVRRMHERGIDQWDEYYPSRQQVLLDIATNTLYGVYHQDQLWGLVVLNEIQDKAYADLEWQTDAEKVLVIHRLAVHPSRQGKGIGQVLMEFAERKALQNQYEAIRLDGFSENKALHTFYLGLGYTHIGDIHLEGQRAQAYHCYEKLISV
ncbi:MAG: GNAT family N-acetyltransferase [Bacteroidota bacterium]